MATTEHYGITEINGTADISNIPINQAFEKIDSEMWKLFQFRGNLTGSDSLNNLSGSGFWRIDGTAPLNSPDSGWVWCIVVQFIYGSVTVQYIIKPSANGFIMREYTGNPQVWSTWRFVGGYTAPVRINYGSNSYIEYWKSGQTGCIKIVYYVSDGSVASWSTKEIATLPEGFRPVQAVMMRGCADRAGDEGTCFSVDGNGSVKIQTRYNAFSTSGGALQGTLTFPIRY